MARPIRPWTHQSPDTRLRHVNYARDQEEKRKAGLQENAAVRLDETRQNMAREETRRNTLQEHEVRRFDDTAQRMDEQRQRKADREARMTATPTPARTTREQLYMEGRRPLEPGERVADPLPTSRKARPR